MTSPGSGRRSPAEKFERCGYDDPDEADPLAADIVVVFAKINNGSSPFGYPVDTRRGPMPLAHDQLDLAALVDVLDALDDYFMGRN